MNLGPQDPLRWETVKTLRDEASELSVEVRRAPLDKKPGAYVYSIQVGGYQKADVYRNRIEKTTPYIPVRFDFERGRGFTLRHPVSRILASMIAEAEQFIVERQRERVEQSTRSVAGISPGFRR